MTEILKLHKIDGRKNNAKYTFVSSDRFGGKYSFKTDELDNFYKQYSTEVKKGAQFFLHEPRDKKSSILTIDLDFHFDDGQQERLYNFEMTRNFVNSILRLIKYHFGITDTYCVIMEKDHPVIYDGVVKDGIHLVFPEIVTTFEVQEWIKVNRITYIQEFFPKVVGNCIDGWQLNDIYDVTHSWSVYMSRKNKKALPYRITHVIGDENKTEQFKNLNLKSKIKELRLNRTEDELTQENFTENTYREKYVKWMEIREKEMEEKEEKENKKIESEEVDGDGYKIKYVGQNDDEIRILLSCLSERRYRKDDWFKVICAIKNSGASLELADEWSSKDPKNGYKGMSDVRSVWLRITERNASIATLHSWARSDNKKMYEELQMKRWDDITYSELRQFKEFSLSFCDVVNFIKVNFAYIRNGGSSYFSIRRRKTGNNLYWDNSRNPFRKKEAVKLCNGEKVKLNKILMSAWMLNQIEYDTVYFRPHPSNRGVYIEPHMFNIFDRYEARILNEVDMDLVDPVLKHIREVWCNDNEKVYDWVISWLADIIQYPENEYKMPTALVVWGDPGVGKSIIAEFIGRKILGDSHFQSLSGMENIMKFNAECRNKILTCFEELRGEMSAHQYSNKLKDMIVRKSQRIERKGYDAEDHPDCNRYILISNDDNPVHIEKGDRRYAVLHCNKKYLKNKEYYDKLGRLMDTDECADNFLTFLVNHKYNRDKLKVAVETDAKIDMKMLKMPIELRFLIDIGEGNTYIQLMGEDRIPVDKRVKSEELLRAFHQWATTRGIRTIIVKHTLTAKLTKLGIKIKDRRKRDKHDEDNPGEDNPDENKRRVRGCELSRPIIEEIVRDYLGSDNYELEPIEEGEVMMVMD